MSACAFLHMALAIPDGALPQKYPVAQRTVSPEAQMWQRLQSYHARKIGRQGMTILDVGANRGEWTRAALKIWPQASIIMLEANPALAGVLDRVAKEVRARGGRAEARIAVLGDDERNVTMHESSTKFMRDTGNSLFRQKTKSSLYQPVQRRMRMLDNVLAELPVPPPASVELLKLDVQGAETLVLQGAERTLRGARFLLLEMSLTVFNEGAPLFADVVAFLAQRGFVLVEVLAQHYSSTGEATQVDGLFKSKWPS